MAGNNNSADNYPSFNEFDDSWAFTNQYPTQGFTTLINQMGNSRYSLPPLPEYGLGQEAGPQMVAHPHSMNSENEGGATAATPVEHEQSCPSPNNTDSATTSGSSRRSRRKTATVWKYFTVTEESSSDGELRKWAVCRTCGNRLSCKSRSGTGHLNRHIEAHVHKGHELVEESTNDARPRAEQIDPVSWKFNQQDARDQLVELMAVTNISFHAAGHDKFASWTTGAMQPLYEHAGRQTLKNDTMNLFMRRREALKGVFSNLNSTYDYYVYMLVL